MAKKKPIHKLDAGRNSLCGAKTTTRLETRDDRVTCVKCRKEIKLQEQRRTQVVQDA